MNKRKVSTDKYIGRFYEFFAGGGMARLGLGPNWECLFANDNDQKKAASYKRNWGGEELKVVDVHSLNKKDLPDGGDLAWASFPCQDLSLAGNGNGLKGERSSTFWPFWRLIEELCAEKTAPKLIVLENVYGALRSHNGKDFVTIGNALAYAGYRFGAVIIDAIHFVPQSRPRLFIIGVDENEKLPPDIVTEEPNSVWHPLAVLAGKNSLPEKTAEKWVWWNLGAVPQRNIEFADIIEDKPSGVNWHSSAETQKLLNMMTDTNKAKVQQAQQEGRKMVGGVYKRMRNGLQRAEVRFDVAGCLRTPVGGSSRQTIIIVEGDKIRSRLLSPREAARLMGLPENYQLPENYNEAYHLSGDGLVIPVVRFLANSILEPILRSTHVNKMKAA